MSRNPLAATVALLAAFVCLPAHAGIVVPKSAEHGAKPLTIRHHHVTVEIDDQVARTTVTQTVENHTDVPLEGSFQFSLPPDAAVVDFVQWIGDKRVGSVVVEKEQAAKEYEKQKSEGHAPALLEMTGDNVFKAKVDAIPAKGVRKTELTYSEILRYEAGQVAYSYPFDFARFYAGSIDNVSFTVKVRDQKKLVGVTPSKKDGVEILRVSDHEIVMKKSGKGLKPDSDLSLTYQVESREMGVNFLTYREPGKDGYFLLMIAPQEVTTDADIVKKDVVFVFDTSGSMEGEKIRQAREALKLSLSSMNPGDGFNVVSFSSGVDPMLSKPVTMDAKSLASAKEYADKMIASGGTNIEGALTEGLRQLEGSTRPSAIVFMTDGMPTFGETDPARIVEIVRAANGKDTRVFAFGAGPATEVNRPLLERIAAENRGSAEFFSDGKRIDEVVAGFYGSISKPVLSDMKLAYGGGITPTMTYPATLPDVYKGQQLVIVGRFRGEGKTELALTGGLNGTVKKYAIPVDFPKENGEWSFVPRVWAQKRVEHLMREMRLNGESAEVKMEVVSLAKEFRIATPWTSFVSKPESTTVASLTPARIKPGDPEIWIDAPADAKRVTVHFPFGLVKRATWDAKVQRWVVRFLIPKSTRDGVYDVKIAITDRAGRTKMHTVRYMVDTRAPALDVVLGTRTVSPGDALRVTVRPVVSMLQIVGELSLDKDRTLKGVKSLVDVKSVVAVTEDGRRSELALGGEDRGWHGVIEAPTSAEGEHTLTIVATDYAGNVRTERLTYDVVR